VIGTTCIAVVVADPGDPEGADVRNPGDPEGAVVRNPGDPEGAVVRNPGDPEVAVVRNPGDPEGAVVRNTVNAAWDEEEVYLESRLPPLLYLKRIRSMY
jgi:hypothetical protein